MPQSEFESEEEDSEEEEESSENEEKADGICHVERCLNVWYQSVPCLSVGR